MSIKYLSPFLVAILGTILLIPSCNDYSSSESLRKDVESIDWAVDNIVDNIVDTTHHGSGSSGGSMSNSSELSLAISFEAPKGHMLPEKSEELIIEKIETAIKKSGGRIIRSERVDSINYTEHSKAFDESTYMFKVIYQIDGTVGSITGVLNKRRHEESRENGKEVIGQLLLSLDEER